MKPLLIPDDVEKLSVVTYRISTGYVTGMGLNPQKIKEFYDELSEKIYPVFEERGWIWKKPTFSSSCPSIVKSDDVNKQIYLHPSELNMCGTKDDCNLLESMLEKNNYNSFKFTDTYVNDVPYYNCSKERVEEIYEMNKDIIKSNIVERIGMGASSESLFFSEIVNFNHIRSTGADNLYGSRLYDESFNKVFNSCMKELQDDNIIEQDKLDYNLCTPRNEPYITVNIKESTAPNRMSSVYRTVATVKTKDCVPVATLYFYPDGSDIKSTNTVSLLQVQKDLQFFVKSNKNTVKKLGELINDKPQFETKQKEFVKKWKEHYLSNTLSMVTKNKNEDCER